MIDPYLVKKFSVFYGTVKFLTCLKDQDIGPILKQLNPIHFNIFLPSVPSSPK